VRACEDDFLNPAAVRHARGRESPEGIFLDSYDLGALARLLLDPFAGGGPFRRRAYDVVTDGPVPAPTSTRRRTRCCCSTASSCTTTSWRERWDLSFLLDVPPEVAAQRLLAREGKPTRDRYVLGQERYFATCDPRARASLVLPW
jgi:uridine kinase